MLKVDRLSSCLCIVYVLDSFVFRVWEKFLILFLVLKLSVNFFMFLISIVFGLMILIKFK